MRDLHRAGERSARHDAGLRTHAWVSRGEPMTVVGSATNGSRLAIAAVTSSAVATPAACIASTVASSVSVGSVLASPSRVTSWARASSGVGDAGVEEQAQQLAPGERVAAVHP